MTSALYSGCDFDVRFLVFGLTVLGVIEARFSIALSLIFAELFRSGSGLRIEVSRTSDVCDSTSFVCLRLGVWICLIVSVVGSLSILSNLNVSTDVSGGCSQTTSGIKGKFFVVVSGVCTRQLWS